MKYATLFGLTFVLSTFAQQDAPVNSYSLVIISPNEEQQKEIENIKTKQPEKLEMYENMLKMALAADKCLYRKLDGEFTFLVKKTLDSDKEDNADWEKEVSKMFNVEKVTPADVSRMLNIKTRLTGSNSEAEADAAFEVTLDTENTAEELKQFLDLPLQVVNQKLCDARGNFRSNIEFDFITVTHIDDKPAKTRTRRGKIVELRVNCGKVTRLNYAFNKPESQPRDH